MSEYFYPTRREFVLAATATCVACACCRGAEGAATDEERAEGGAEVDIGEPDLYKPGSIIGAWARSRKFFVARDDKALYAPVAVCTHKHCTLKILDGDGFRCPCHNSHFNLAGKVTKGPARIALPRCQITLAASGRVLVDPTIHFAEDQWNDPRCFIALARS
jgi:Rieske Fe-S protein